MGKLTRVKEKQEKKLKKATEKGKPAECEHGTAVRRPPSTARRATAVAGAPAPLPALARSSRAPPDVRADLAYKKAKVNFITVMIKQARLISNLKDAGLM